MNTKYIAPTLTPFGSVSEITGITGFSTSQDFLKINGAIVQSGEFGTGDPAQLNCDFRLSGGQHTYLGDVRFEDDCKAILDEHLSQ